MPEQIRARIATPAHKARMAGFTLIELMIAVAIVGILAAIATASYQNQVMKSRRTDARSALLDIAGREEKLFSMTNAYSATATDLGYTGTFPLAVGSGYYNVTVAIGNPATTYTITATPIATSPQVKDTTCTSLILDQTGAQTATPSANANTCWKN